MSNRNKNERTDISLMNCRTESGMLIYTIEDGKVCITGFEGSGSVLAIPETVDEALVCGIDKKAFLGNRSLQQIILPRSIEWIGDWAFCNCVQLQRISFPHRPMRLGKGLFAKDERLCEITCESGNEKPDFPGRMLAVAVTLMDAEYLLDMTQAGCAEWYRQLDNRLLSFLMELPENVLKDLVYCAEEDMGAKQEAYLAEQERRKAYMALLRLAYPERLGKETAEQLKTYLLDQNGLQTKSAWETIKNTDGKEQLLFCNIMLKINGIREENLPQVLEDLGEAYVELKAYLLGAWEQRGERETVWEMYAL